MGGPEISKNKVGVSEMAEQKENPTKCERCGSTEQPINTCNPNTSGYPTKRVDLCSTCIAEDPKVTFVSGPGFVPPPTPERVPDIAPVVPVDPNVVETTEFGPKLQEPIVEPQTPAGKLTGKDPEPPTDLGPVPPDVLRQKLAKHEDDHNKLMENRKNILGGINKAQEQLAQLNAVIQAKRGAIAQLRDLLGNAS